MSNCLKLLALVPDPQQLRDNIEITSKLSYNLKQLSLHSTTAWTTTKIIAPHPEHHLANTQQSSQLVALTFCHPLTISHKYCNVSITMMANQGTRGLIYVVPDPVQGKSCLNNSSRKIGASTNHEDLHAS